ncbi:nucleotide-binding domain-containing protein [Coccomyxa subellipsoidea C-169]|uniref:NADH:ubiquinone reductase (non-electrogenic) n=1 Tax=Coccomyxa subellipsoidea (strain C-169) TaxID=574566 RepID=I0YLN3_COCSC|nr:nucleotide-binding domain-containing protein [Coccomyxa subellipsoidea C-169]EIE19302.1 nucleotide-binding domain-containing protein [Coccomyxa subellipsoidea C-169]|eukprot:XP_005643846.1 nucleotide-binding domain-containing protein [Coccomyxa subellipsoidea C-169]
MPVYYGRGGKYSGKPRVVVLGSGWGAMSFIKSLSRRDSENLEVTIVSPRNYFLYTPLLPACATGTVEERSIIEPVRKVLGTKGTFFEAVCQEIDPVEKTIKACIPSDPEDSCFKVPYDILVLAVGSVNNTFGIKGVAEHTTFFKSIDDAHNLRRKVSECFERASLPAVSQEERERLLSFVIVGGGPTGVEVAAELHDMVVDDLRRIYPSLVSLVRIRVIELQDHVLSTYDREISTYTASEFSRRGRCLEGIDLVLNSRVASVAPNKVIVVNSQTNSTNEIPFGACVWATGVAMHPLIKQLQERLPEGSQTHFRSIVTDQYLRVLGSGGSIYAIGDAATIQQACTHCLPLESKALSHSEELFDQADVSKDGKLQLSEVRDILRKSSEDYSHFAEHARFLDGKYGGLKRWNSMVGKLVKKRTDGTPVSALGEDTELDKDAFREIIGKIDQGLRALPATAQVAKQQGEYVAKLLSKGKGTPGKPITGFKGFRYGHKGSLAYVGRDKAVMDVPAIGPVFGYTAGVMWKGFETYSQISLRNILLVSSDWVRTKLFGRDISRV